MRVGIFTAADPRHGGVYQYGLTMVDAARAMARNQDEYEFVAVCDAGANPPARLTHGPFPLVRFPAFSSPRVRYPFLLRAHAPAEWPRLLWRRARLGRRFERAAPNGIPRSHRQFALSAWLERQQIELMVYTLPMATAFQTDVPYVFVVHDLQHRVSPQFPEFSADGEWERREYVYGNGVAQARLVVTTSDTGKEDVVRYYGDRVSAGSVAVVPQAAPSYLRVDDPATEAERARRQHRLPERYLFYPAQFWPHKNHARLIEALALLRREHGIETPLVLTGSAPDPVRARCLADAQSRARALGVADLVRVLGYLDDDLIAGLYAGATALVMPTLAGAANIPVLEAWTLGCPVITSDIRGVRDQVGPAALLADPTSPAALAAAVYTLWTDNERRAELAEAGRRRLRERHSPEQFARSFRRLLEAAGQRPSDHGHVWAPAAAV